MAGETLVLWDIDHTLMETGGVGALAYQAAEQAGSTANGGASYVREDGHCPVPRGCCMR